MDAFKLHRLIEHLFCEQHEKQARLSKLVEISRNPELFEIPNNVYVCNRDLADPGSIDWRLQQKLNL